MSMSEEFFYQQLVLICTAAWFYCRLCKQLLGLMHVILIMDTGNHTTTMRALLHNWSVCRSWWPNATIFLLPAISAAFVSCLITCDWFSGHYLTPVHVSHTEKWEDNAAWWWWCLVRVVNSQFNLGDATCFLDSILCEAVGEIETHLYWLSQVTGTFSFIWLLLVREL